MKRKQPHIVANWKMQPGTIGAARELLRGVVKQSVAIRGVQITLCAPFVFISDLRRSYRGKAINFGAQDVSAHERGAHTGEVSVGMLQSVGARAAIVGHSERRASGESDALVAQKLLQTLRGGLVAILCIGEQERDERGEYLQVIRQQLQSALSSVSPLDLELGKLTIAYEPVWAIGKSGKDAMQPEAMHEMTIYIRKIVSERYGIEKASMVSILYGGSVEPSNSGDLLARAEIDGFLVGHASLEPQDFGLILKAAQHTKAQ